MATTVSVTMLQTKRGEDGAWWLQGDTKLASLEFARLLIGANAATGTLPPDDPGVSPWLLREVSAAAIASGPAAAGVVRREAVLGPDGSIYVGRDALNWLRIGTTIVAAVADTTAPTLSGVVTASAITETTATISWPAGADAVGVTGYRYSVNGGSTYTTVGNVLTAALTGLVASTTYALRVQALDAAGNASPAISGSLTTAAAAGDTTAPTLSGVVTASAITETTATISWPAGSDAVGVTGYRYSVNGGSTYTTVGNVLTAALTGLVASTTYALRVQALDAAGNASPAISGSLTTAAAAGDTTAPTLSGVVTASAITETTATISWPAGSDGVGVTGYRYSVNGGSTYTTVGNVLTAALTGLVASTTYALRVQALDAAGNASSAISGTLTTAAPVADTRPRTFIGPATAHTTGTQALLDGATVVPGSTAGGKVGGPFTVSPAAGQYGWLAVLASASAAGVTFTDALGSGGWQGAGLAGANSGASPSTSTSAVTFTDAGGTTWRLFRQDYAASPFTGSIA